ncbi:disulfide bond formation protein B [Chromatium okenii]|uniref:disulfide bond formation protein B n=1 Tax=Chromatium okenii TaxID=61644 RepID=UPI0026EFCC36|nr:disulfide bond formation protein B [Chromatium okenii]MBV5307956.1 disulfide bond formation protein B [Chromatium okenii]
MRRISTRALWLLLAVITATVAAASIILTPWFDLDPCYLCIFQRLLFMVLALLAILATSGIAQLTTFAGLLFIVVSAGGVSVAAYQSWLQWQPADTVSCVGGQPNLLEQLIEWLGEKVPALFLASGFCEDRGLVIFGLSLANLAGLVFSGALALALWAWWQSKTRHLV